LTLEKQLRKLPKLAQIRMSLVFITLSLWMFITSRLIRFFGRPFHGVLGWFSFVTSIVDMVGATWLFWCICLRLFVFVEKDAREACKTIGQWLPYPTSEDQSNSIRMIWWEPKRVYNPLLPFIWFCRLYLVPKHRLLQALLWVLAEIIIPIRIAYILLFVLLFTGMINVILDMITNGLQTSWGFGQLLPAFMLLLPFFSLAQTYYKKSKLPQEEHGPVTMLGTSEELDNVVEREEIKIGSGPSHDRQRGRDARKVMA